MLAAILCIGTELTRGAIADGNGRWLGRELAESGLEVDEIALVPDTTVAIVGALQRLAENHELILCTGGLGPTSDDRTTAAVATLLGEGIARDEATLDRIGQRLAKLGRTLTPSDAKQAELPQSAQSLPNEQGMAVGFVVTIGRAQAYFLPGVPQEMRAMYAEQVAPRLRTPSEPTVELTLRCFGIGESSLGDRLAGIESACDVTLGYRAHFPEIEVKVLARGPSRPAASAAAQRGAAMVRARLDPGLVYGEGGDPLPAVVATRLQATGQRLALAESCTGGLLGALLTERPGASRFLIGGAVAYADSAKTALLGVPAALLATHGAVSAEVAQAMAEGARRAFGAELALSITGIAGPDGGSLLKPVGRVELCVAGPERSVCQRCDFGGSRERIRILAAWTAMKLLLRCLDEQEPR